MSRTGAGQLREFPQRLFNLDLKEENETMRRGIKANPEQEQLNAGFKRISFLMFLSLQIPPPHPPGSCKNVTNSPAFIIQKHRATAFPKSFADGGEAERGGEGIGIRIKSAIPAHIISRQLQGALVLPLL